MVIYELVRNTTTLLCSEQIKQLLENESFKKQLKCIKERYIKNNHPIIGQLIIRYMKLKGEL